MKTSVTRYFETVELLNESVEAFEKSGFFTHHEIKQSGNYTILRGESAQNLYTMKTKFPDAIEEKE